MKASGTQDSDKQLLKLQIEQQKLDLMQRVAGAKAPAKAARKTKWLSASSRRFS